MPSAASAKYLLGVVGGTFDPIHRGHTEPVIEISQRIAFGEVRYIPAAVPPHRAQPIADGHHRLAMVKLAISQWPNFRADDCELKRNGPSYMVDTLAELRAANPAATLVLVLGLDSFLTLPDWYRWRSLLDLAHIAVMNRPGWSPPESLPKWWASARTTALHDMLKEPAGCIVEQTVSPVDVSSTKVREQLNRGCMPSTLLDPQVVKYIHDNGLYAMKIHQSAQSRSP